MGDEDIEEKIIVFTDNPVTDLSRTVEMDQLDRITMFKPVDIYQAQEMISSDLKKYRIVQRKCTITFNSLTINIKFNEKIYNNKH